MVKVLTRNSTQRGVGCTWRSSGHYYAISSNTFRKKLHQYKCIARRWTGSSIKVFFKRNIHICIFFFYNSAPTMRLVSGHQYQNRNIWLCWCKKSFIGIHSSIDFFTPSTVLCFREYKSETIAVDKNRLTKNEKLQCGSAFRCSKLYNLFLSKFDFKIYG